MYHPGSPRGGDGALSWDTGWEPYIDPGNYTNAISNAPDDTFEDGMITAIALQRIARLATETKVGKGKGKGWGGAGKHTTPPTCDLYL